MPNTVDRDVDRYSVHISSQSCAVKFILEIKHTAEDVQQLLALKYQ